MPEREPRPHLRVLVTNDDGIEAPALALLAARLRDHGHEVQVAAPYVEQTGCGASIGKMDDGVLVAMKEVSLANAPGVPAVAVDAPPALAVLAACEGVFGLPPDVVVSGTNAGYNTGPVVLHSGTLSAALTAAANGLPGIALSSARHGTHGFATAAELCARTLLTMVARIAPRSALNINVPDLPLDRLAGVRATMLGTRSLVSIGVAREDRALRLHRVPSSEEAEVDSDMEAVRSGYVSVTEVHGGVRDLAQTSRLTEALDALLWPGAPAAPANEGVAHVRTELSPQGRRRHGCRARSGP